VIVTLRSLYASYLEFIAFSWQRAAEGAVSIRRDHDAPVETPSARSAETSRPLCAGASGPAWFPGLDRRGVGSGHRRRWYVAGSALARL